MCEAPFSGAGMRILEVPYQGNTNTSLEEAEQVAQLADMFASCS